MDLFAEGLAIVANAPVRENEEPVPFQSRLEDPSDQSEKEDEG